MRSTAWALTLARLQGPPIVNDNQPFYGSQFDTTTVDKQPVGAKENYANSNIASNLTFATLPLTFQGWHITEVMEQNLNPVFDTPDIQQDIPYIQNLKIKPVHWRWYQEGYDLESTDTTACLALVLRQPPPGAPVLRLSR